MQENSELHRKVRNLEKEKNSYERKLAMVSRSLITTPPCDAVQAAAVRPRDGSQVLEVNTPNKSPRSLASSSPSQNTNLQVSSTAGHPQDTDMLNSERNILCVKVNLLHQCAPWLALREDLKFCLHLPRTISQALEPD